MKKIIPFILVICIALAAFFGMQHFNSNNVTTAETIVKEEISLPDLSVETPSTQEVVSEPEVTPTPAPTATPAPTEDPQLMYVMKDSVTGKIFYQADSEEIVLKRIRESITAEDAVDAVECVNYGAMMVVSHDDERIVEGITAYDLISDEDALKVTFNRNGSKLYVCDEKDFEPSEKTNKTFSGLADKKAYGAWICSEHTAFKGSALVYEGYPKSEGYRGPFAVADGFSAKVLKSVVLINTEDNRYDWVLVTCDCKDAVAQAPSGGNGGGSSGGGSKPPQDDDDEPSYSPEPDDDDVYNPSYSPELDLDDVYGDEPVVSDEQDVIVQNSSDDEPSYSPVEDVYVESDVYTEETEAEAEVSVEEDVFSRDEEETSYSASADVYSVAVVEDDEPEYSAPVDVYSDTEVAASEPAVAEVSAEEDVFAR